MCTKACSTLVGGQSDLRDVFCLHFCLFALFMFCVVRRTSSGVRDSDITTTGGDVHEVQKRRYYVSLLRPGFASATFGLSRSVCRKNISRKRQFDLLTNTNYSSKYWFVAARCFE